MDMELIIISDELQQYLQDLRSSSGAGASAMLRGANDRPKGLDAAMVNRWLSGKTRTARSDYWNYVLKRWSEMPKWMKITPEIRRAIQLEHERTGIGAIALLNIAGSLNGAIKPSAIDHWLAGVRDKAPEEHVHFVLNAWRMLPPMEWIRLTPQHLSDLADLRNRLHLNPRILIRHARDCPGNLNENKIYDILGGRYKQIRKTHFDFLMGLLSG